jgi:sugar/nucleoside kinase (ribokinase family)
LGDGLAVGFLSIYYIEQMSLPDSIQRGQIVARYTCTQKASTSNLMTRKKLDTIFQSIKIVYNKKITNPYPY